MVQFRPVQRLGVLIISASIFGCAVDPEPLTKADYSARSTSDLKLIGQMEYKPVGPISLNQAIARAVAFNLQRRVKEIEREIEDAKLQTQSIDMLPSFDIDAARNSTSVPLSQTDSPLTRTASAGITWNILDLGVSYARAKQQADEVLVARENERKALQDITRDVRTAYWRAVGAQRLMGKVQRIARNIKVAMRESRAMERSGANDVVKSVAYRREIVGSVRQALTIQRELREARGELAEYLNIRPGTDFTLATVSLASAMPALPMSLPEMERHALENRPELRVEDYNERMSEWQAREALFEMLPGAKLTAGKNYSSDAFNLTPNWISTGFQLGMNIFDLFSGTSRMDEADKRGELARSQRLALTLAVMTQTHMAYIQFRNASQQMRLAREVARADRRLARLVASDTDFLNTDYFEAVRLSTRQLQSEVDEHQSQVDMIAAHSGVMHAIGLDVFPEKIQATNLAELTAEVGKITAKWEHKGDGPDLEPETPLDLLVDAMLLGGEQAPGTKPDPGELREAKADDIPAVPSFDRVAEAIEQPVVDPAILSAFETASGTPGPMLIPDKVSENTAIRAVPFETMVSEEAAEIASLVEEFPDAPAVAIPATVTPTVTPTVIPRVPSVPAHVVQLGVFSSEAKADRLKQRLTAAPDGALYGVDIRVVRRSASTGKMLHYVETAAIAEQSIARELCTTLKGLGQDCVSVTR
jgi:outer membrane protein, multidrug efflux system